MPNTSENSNTFETKLKKIKPYNLFDTSYTYFI